MEKFIEVAQSVVLGELNPGIHKFYEAWKPWQS